MVVLMRQHGVELGFAEEVQGGLGNVDPRAEVAGAKGLGVRVRDHADTGMVTEMTDYLEPSEQPAVGAALAECSPDREGDRRRADQREAEQEPRGAV
jgi:hypothetical protein